MMRRALPGGFLTTGLAGSQQCVVRVADADRDLVASEGLTPPAVSVLFRFSLSARPRVAARRRGSASLSLLAATWVRAEHDFVWGP
jgi:hypothetical protein